MFHVEHGLPVKIPGPTTMEVGERMKEDVPRETSGKARK
jgi:hypothetical protein